MGDVTLRMEDSVAILIMDNPGRLNAISRNIRLKIQKYLSELKDDPAVSGVVLTGAGTAFCAGGDLNEMMLFDENTPWVAEFGELVVSVMSFPKPVIAAVNGVAAGGGFQLALVCDTRLGHPGTRMGQPEVKRGLASITGSWFLRRSVGELRARELTLSGRLMEAPELLSLGFLESLENPEDLLSSAIRKCRVFASSPSASFIRTKQWLLDSMIEEFTAVLDDAARLHSQGFASGISQKGAAAFVQRADGDR